MSQNGYEIGNGFYWRRSVNLFTTALVGSVFVEIDTYSLNIKGVHSTRRIKYILQSMAETMNWIFGSWYTLNVLQTKKILNKSSCWYRTNTEIQIYRKSGWSKEKKYILLYNVLLLKFSKIILILLRQYISILNDYNLLV